MNWQEAGAVAGFTVSVITLGGLSIRAVRKIDEVIEATADMPTLIGRVDKLEPRLETVEQKVTSMRNDLTNAARRQRRAHLEIMEYIAERLPNGKKRP